MKKYSCVILVTIIFLHTTANAQKRLGFVPSRHGFHFANLFTTDVDVAGIKTYGLCGGMALAAFNYYRYNIPIPNLRNNDIDFNVTFHASPFVTSGTTELVDYIYHSQMATILTNVSVIGFGPAHNPDYVVEFNKAKARIDRGEFLILGLKMQPGQDGKGHQVLCYGYNDKTLELYIYDPNNPDEEVRITPYKVGDHYEVLLYKGNELIEKRFKSFFEMQELFPGRTSDRTTYDMVDNVLRNLNYAVRPPAAAPPAKMKGFGYQQSNFNYEANLPPHDLYKMMINSTSKMLEVEDAAFAGGTKVQQYFSYERNAACDGKNQQWLLIPAGTRGTEPVFYIINYGFLKYLEAGSNATVQEGNNSDNQLWFIQPTATTAKYHVKSVAFGTYLEIPVGAGADGDRFRMGAFTGGSNQLFSFTRYSGATGLQSFSPLQNLRIVPSYSDGKSLALPNGSTANENPLQLWDAKGLAGEYWQINRGSDGYYSIVPKLAPAAKCASVYGESEDNGAAIVNYDYSNNRNQRWIVIPVVRQPGKYIFFSKHSGKCMSVTGGNNTSNGAAIVQSKYVNQDNCKWILRAY
jgi:hypothetical protein